MISIIVPVYNAGNYIRDTIRSVKAQTYTDWELILVDDLSKDNSVEIIEEEIRLLDEGRSSFDANAPSIRLIRKEINEGAAKARNTGIDAAKGRYIAFLDADDIWYPEKLEKELALMQAKDEAFVFTAYHFGDENAVPTGKVVHVPEHLNYRQALPRTIIFTSTVLFDTVKIDRELIHMPCIASEDTATWWRILKTGVTAAGLDEPLVVYRRPGASLSSNKGVAVQRIWGLYRKVAGLGIPASAYYTIQWAWHATMRRVIRDRSRIG